MKSRKKGHFTQVNASMDHMRLRNPGLANTALVAASMDSMPVKNVNQPIINKYVEKKSTMRLQYDS